MLRFMGSQTVGHDWATELNWTELNWRIMQRKEADKLKECDVSKAWKIQHSTIKIAVILVNIK